MRLFGELEHLSADHEDNGTNRPQWAIKAEPNVAVRLKRFFPRVDSDRTGRVFITDTPEVGRDLEMILGRWPMKATPAALKRIHERAEEHLQTEERVSSILAGRHLEGMQEPARKPRDYQLQAADVTLATGRLLLADVVGLGKTFSSLLVLRDPRALPALIVTLTHLPKQWLEELNETLPWLRAHIVRSTRVYDPSEKREMKGHHPDVLICNYAKLPGWSDHLAGEVKTVIFDEVQELRHHNTIRYTAAAQVADAAGYRMGLSATPVYNYGGEIHNVFSVLAPDVLGTRGEFEREWGKQENGQLAVKDPKALGAWLRDEGLMLRRTRKDVGRELPDVVRVPHAIEADSDRLEKLSGDAVDLARLIVDDASDAKEVFKAKGEFDMWVRKETGIAKAPFVADFVRMLVEDGEKVVLFGWHHDVYRIWGNRLRDLDLVFYTGRESKAQKEAAKDAFTKGDAQVFVMSLRAGAGLNGLQDVAHVCVFGELDWSPAMHDQCIGRLHRDGQAESTVAYFLTSAVGSDPTMAQVLQLKRMQAEPLMDGEAELFAPTADSGDRIRDLAKDFLDKRDLVVAA
jgi:SNF2 family DNA or RNA helicase